MDGLMSLKASRDRDLAEKRASARSKTDIESIDAFNDTAVRRGPFARLLHRKPKPLASNHLY
jgi:hypothetical protein